MLIVLREMLFILTRDERTGKCFERDLLVGVSLLISEKKKSFRGRRKLFAACSTVVSRSPNLTVKGNNHLLANGFVATIYG